LSESQAAKLDTRALLCLCGLGLFLAAQWSQNLLPSNGETGLAASIITGIVPIVTYACIAWQANPFYELLSQRGVLVALVALSLIGNFNYALPAFIQLPAWLYVCGQVLAIVSGACLLIAWLSHCATLMPRQVGMTLSAAYLIAGVLYFPLEFLPATVSAPIMALLPVASAMLLMHPALTDMKGEAAEELSDAALSDLYAFEQSQKPGLASKLEPVEAIAEDSSETAWRFPWYPALLVFGFKAVFSFALPFTAGPSLYGPLGMLIIAAISFIGAKYFFHTVRASVLYKIGLPCMIAGLLILAWFDHGSVVSTAFMNIGNIAFELFIVIALCEICYRWSINPIWMFGIIWAASAAGQFVARLAGTLIVAAHPLGTTETNLIMLIIVVALVALSSFFFNDRVLMHAFGAQPNLASEEGEEHVHVMTYYEDLIYRCETVAREYGLSKREEEILELIAQGMSGPRIEEELVISRNTVKTHTSHIYEKLGVHSRDEARRLVEEI